MWDRVSGAAEAVAQAPPPDAESVLLDLRARLPVSLRECIVRIVVRRWTEDA